MNKMYAIIVTGGKPVSYTHLDVYKRQPCFGVGFKEEPLPADDLRTEALYDLVPVSYTHLAGLANRWR